MSTIENPAAELAIRYGRAPISHSHRLALEVSWLLAPDSHGRGVAPLLFVDNRTQATRLDVIVFDPTRSPPFQVVTGLTDGHPPPASRIGVSPGRKAVAMVSVAPRARWLGAHNVLPISAGPPPGPHPASAHELELVACIVDRLSEGSLLDDLADAGLRLSLDVRRLATPLGRLKIRRGSTRWAEEGT